MKIFPNFNLAILETQEAIRTRSVHVRNEKWQGVDISTKPEMATFELLNWSFQVPMRAEFDLEAHRADIKPNLPWADDHFLERVGGVGLNPGVQWARWPYAKSADRFRDANGQFTHTYMERYWPKEAGSPSDLDRFGIRGIRYDYGDLDDVVDLLAREPTTRQAYLPVWFPEDTGALHGGRLPCSIGYHFICRGNYLHVVYQLRSCDFVRHFRDDIYLTVRLVIWVLEQLKKKSTSRWTWTQPGLYTMHITSLHVFRADWPLLFGVDRRPPHEPPGGTIPVR